MISNEQDYQKMRKLAEHILNLIADFPIHEFSAYAEQHHPEDRVRRKMWAGYLETGDF